MCVPQPTLVRSLGPPPRKDPLACLFLPSFPGFLERSMATSAFLCRVYSHLCCNLPPSLTLTLTLTLLPFALPRVGWGVLVGDVTWICCTYGSNKQDKNKSGIPIPFLPPPKAYSTRATVGKLTSLGPIRLATCRPSFPTTFDFSHYYNNKNRNSSRSRSFYGTRTLRKNKATCMFPSPVCHSAHFQTPAPHRKCSPHALSFFRPTLGFCPSFFLSFFLSFPWLLGPRLFLS
jgi:hypothetical protein